MTFATMTEVRGACPILTVAIAGGEIPLLLMNKV